MCISKGVHSCLRGMISQNRISGETFIYFTMLDSWQYSTDEKLEILDKAAKFMTENIDSINDLEGAYREISRFFISSVKRQYGEDFTNFDAAIHFVERYQ